MSLMSLIQRAIKSERKWGSITASEPVRLIPASVRISFTIKVYTPITGQNSDEYPIEVKELKAGKTYDVVILCEQSHNRPDQEDISVEKDFTLSILGKFSSRVSYQPPHQKFHVAYEDICKSKYQLPIWSVTIPEDIPTCKLTFSLIVKEPASYPYENIAPCTLPIEGNTVLEDTQLLDACNIAVGLPEYAMVLSVAYTNLDVPSEQYTIIGHSRLIGNFTFVLHEPSILGLAQRYPREKISTILDTIHYFSKHQADTLLKHLNNFYDACRERHQHPCLIVVDTTGKAEIPWELLELDTDEFLGAIAQVVRWYPITSFGRRSMLQVEEKLYEGSVLTYLDESLKAAEQETEALDRLMLHKMPTLQELGARMYQPGGLKHIGLVYVACHGLKGNHLIKGNSDDDLQRPHDGLRALQMARIPRYAGERPIFFVNACESARMLHGDKVDPSSFAESFLAQCASNYIGTTAPVGSRQAASIARYILELARETEGVQIAELLRLLRQRAVDNLRPYILKDDAQKEFYKKVLFYTFMYVYYGNPLARLRLFAADSTKEGA